MQNYNISPFLRQWIGFDKLVSNIQEDVNRISYPPYNIEKNGDNLYRIVLALSGFSKEELSIELAGTELTIKGKPSLADKDIRYLHQGMICKKFNLSFTLAEHMKVIQADFRYGLLNIDLERHIPESLQPARVTIKTASQLINTKRFKSVSEKK